VSEKPLGSAGGADWNYGNSTVLHTFDRGSYEGVEIVTLEAAIEAEC
jgi:hypothetical protein